MSLRPNGSSIPPPPEVVETREREIHRSRTSDLLRIDASAPLDDTTLATFEAAMARDPGDARALVRYTRLLERQGKLEHAVELLRAGLSRLRNRRLALGELGRIYGNNGLLEECAAVWQDALALVPGDVEAMSALGRVSSRLGRHADAVRWLAEVVRRSPTAEAQADLGAAYCAAGAFGEARRLFEAILASGAESSQVYCNLGAVLLELGQHADAAAHFRRTVELAPRWPLGHFNLALALKALGQNAEAREAAVRAQTLAPDDPQVQALLDELPATDSGAPGWVADKVSFAGHLDRFALPSLLEFLKNSESTGRLALKASLGTAALWLYRGNLIGGESASMRRLGAALVDQGLITPTDLEAAIREQHEAGTNARLLGAILLRRGSVTRERLESVLFEQLSRVVLEVFGWQEGEFAFEESPASDPRFNGMAQVDTRQILFEAMRIYDETKPRTLPKK